MCDIDKGSVTASQSQPANLYAQYALTYAADAAKGIKLAPGQPGGGAPALQDVSYQGDTNLADPIVAPFVTKAQQTLTISSPVDGLPGSGARGRAGAARPRGGRGGARGGRPPRPTGLPPPGGRLRQKGPPMTTSR